MNGTLPIRGSNVPFAFNPGTNASVAVGGSQSSANVPQDRLIVGVDFGTTYSGGFETIGALCWNQAEVE
jgi:hypothetical protein